MLANADVDLLIERHGRILVDGDEWRSTGRANFQRSSWLRHTRRVGKPSTYLKDWTGSIATIDSVAQSSLGWAFFCVLALYAGAAKRKFGFHHRQSDD